MKQRRLFRLGIVVALVVLAADQASKWWVLAWLHLGQRGPLVLLPVLDFRLVRNTGITFGLLNQSSDVGPLLLALVAIIVVFGLGIWLSRAERPLIACSIGAIAGGAIGNVADRLRLGWVVDFIQAHAFGWSWYVFNLADAAIVCGVAALLLDGILGDRRHNGRQAGMLSAPDGEKGR
ncbi:MAG TPA: signal peptidase II [Acetobacteraceae bacterium]|nr:signal peptidase II [Acetobacteraceae bacterium]